VNETSWSISATGTPDEIQAQVHEHERLYWKHMPLGERLLAHHTCGHLVEHARERGPDSRWALSASGHADGGDSYVSASIGRVHETQTAP
jgi:hypothetical protein